MPSSNAHRKGFIRFGLTHFRSISSHSTDHETQYQIAQKASFNHRRQNYSGCTRQQQVKTQRLDNESYESLSNLAKCWKTKHSMNSMSSCGGGIIACQRSAKAESYVEIFYMPLLRKCVPLLRYYGTNRTFNLSEKRFPQKRGLSTPSTKMLLRNGTEMSLEPKPLRMTTNGRAFKSRKIQEYYNSLPIRNLEQNQHTDSSPNYAVGLGAMEVNSNMELAAPKSSRRRVTGNHFDRGSDRPLTRGMHATGPYHLTSKVFRNAPSSSYAPQFTTHRLGSHRVELVGIGKEQRRPLHAISRASKKQIEAAEKPFSAALTIAIDKPPIVLGQIIHGDGSSGVRTWPIVRKTTAGHPTKYIHAKDPAPSKPLVKSCRKHFTTWQILPWLRHTETGTRRSSNSRQEYFYGSSLPEASQASIEILIEDTDRRYSDLEFSEKKPLSKLIAFDPWLSQPDAQPKKRHSHSKEEIGSTGSSPVSPERVPFKTPWLRERPMFANALQVKHVLDHSGLDESKLSIGDPVKRNIASNRLGGGLMVASLLGPLSPPSQETLLGRPLSCALPILDGTETGGQDLLEGLQLGLRAILDSDVDFCAKEVLCTSLRRFLVDMAALGDLRGS